MSASRRDLLRWQFELTWSLLELHLDQLAPEDFLWEPAPHCWTIRLRADGVWLPDWEESEPEPLPALSIGWVTWHIGWWWSVTVDHAEGRKPRERTEIVWPGAGASTVDWLRGLRADWQAVLDRLDDADLDRIAPFPWQDDQEKTVAHMVAWVNSELMKNASEIGQIRMWRGALASSSLP